jgi:riboflavin kinase/FMN adenylyltransferase
MIELTGKVVNGKKFGRILGFPTANLDRRQYVRQELNIKFGIWAGSVVLQTTNYKLQTFLAAIVIGPIDKKGLPKIEAHIIGFSGNLYGKKITITLKKYIIPFKKYKNIEDLKKQINKDIKNIKALKNYV